MITREDAIKKLNSIEEFNVGVRSENQLLE